MDTLFDVDVPPTRPAPKESEGVRRTKRQAALLAAGQHPLSVVLPRPLPLHPEAAPYDDRQAEGRRCGNCAFRTRLSHRAGRYAKCAFGDGARASHGAATDVRAWWSACADHEWKEAR
ncbi:hypothetical protein ACFYOK_37510 [Microbispora bryophytorum]|uniref:hypothetical protein n=1 Tax=Microbispora bryophytorum TaxID=1460882 RepID=UPI0033E85C0E